MIFWLVEFYLDEALMVGLFALFVWKKYKLSVCNTMTNRTSLIVIDDIFLKITHLDRKNKNFWKIELKKKAWQRVSRSN